MAEAVRIAIGSPSVCNRATGRVHFYRGTERIGRLLELQQGNRGLTGVRQLAVATVELSMFAGSKEFAQPWIDGGLFLMNLVWGFQAQGIGTCLLNWSMPEAAGRRLRAVAGIPESELVVCLLAFGYPLPGTFVTRSDKPPLSAVMTVHDEPVGSQGLGHERACGVGPVVPERLAPDEPELLVEPPGRPEELG